MLFSDCSDRIPFVGILWLVKFLLWKTSGHHHAMYVDFFFLLALCEVVALP